MALVFGHFERSKIMSKKPTRMMWIRMVSIVLIITLSMIVVCGYSLTKIMVIDGDMYKEKAAEQQLYDTQTTALRGNIYDCNMNLLATSATVWKLFVTPNDFAENYKTDKEIESVKLEIATGLDSIIDIESEKILECLNKNTSYVAIKENIEQKEADKIRKFIADNDFTAVLGLDESSKRYYPNETLASTVLGFVGKDNQGLYGIEMSYNTELTGTPGRVVASKNANGADMKFSYEYVEESQKGDTLVLTLDSYIQEVVEKYLDEAVTENKVKNRGTCIVMNVKTGGILAMAVSDDFNPNKPFTLPKEYKSLLKGLKGEEYQKKKTEYMNEMWRNKAISSAYEPGSVFKIVTCAAALEENVTSLSSTYNCNGSITVAGQGYNCHKTQGHGTQTLSETMQNSCNPVYITLGQLLGVKRFSKYFRAFGLAEKTGIDLPSEQSSIFHNEENMGAVELASAAFGQTMQVTPIQMITAAAATVNGGYLVQPHVVSEIRSTADNSIKTTKIQKKRQVISQETSKTMAGLLYDVVELGGGKNAYVTGYKVGGKTGTSQKVAENLKEDRDDLYVGSFLGVAPADDPEIAILFLLDTPTNGDYYGSVVSAPWGGKILSEILPYLGHEPHYKEEELKSMAKVVDSVLNEDVTSAQNTLNSNGFTVRVVGNGNKVTDQMPEGGAKIYDGGVVILYTDGAKATNTTVPDFAGKTVSEVNTLAANSGINVSLEGSSLSNAGVTAYSQSATAGTKIELGTTVTVYFRDDTARDF